MIVADTLLFQRRDKSLSSLIYINYTGVVNMTPELGMILSGHPEAKTTDFGDSCTCSTKSKPSLPPNHVNPLSNHPFPSTSHRNALRNGR